MFFGQKLKEYRLKYANMGLHKFAEKIKMSVSEYSKIERGYVKPPKDTRWITRIIDSFGINFPCSEETKLLKLWKKKFVMQKMSEGGFVSPFVSKSDGTLLTTEEIVDLNEYINNYKKEHNKKADEYNKGKK
jgi:transcriptional regulator with XRE-family HTH domain